MSDYVVSARKYRPDSFGTLVGQDNIARTLKNSIQRGQLAHAYLFCGPRGVGKTTTARIFAKMINCSSPLPGGEPCGECESCKSFAEGRSYCIYEMDAASNNSVDDIKELIDKVRIPPQVGKYSVYIIDEVHMLSQQAFNAFLKTLEEPPAYAIFILATTEKHKILPTILSRCQIYDFNRITVDNIVRNLSEIAKAEGVQVDDESLHMIAIKADGAMRDALTIFDQTRAFCGNDIKREEVIRNLNILDYTYSFHLVEKFLAGDYAAALRTFDDILSRGFNALYFISSLSSHLRDLLVAKAGGIDSLLELAGSVKDQYRAQAMLCSEKFLYDALNLTVGCETAYKNAVNPRLTIEFTLMRLCFLCRQPSEAAAAQTAPQTQAKAPAPAPAAPVEAPAPAPAAPAEVPDPAPAAPVEVPDPAPAAPAASVEAPASAPARPQSSKRPSLSLKSLSEKVAESDEASQTADGSSAQLISDEAILKAWDTLCNISQPNQRLYNALHSAHPEIREENGRKKVSYFVVNESLKSWLDDKNARIEGKLRELCASNAVDLIVVLKEDPEGTQVALNAEDKTKMMMDNPVVGKLIADLSLELK